MPQQVESNPEQSERLFDDTTIDIEKVSRKTPRTHRLILKEAPMDLPVYEIPVKYLWFHIENGRYADRMIRLRSESPNIRIDAKDRIWRSRIQELLMGKGSLSDPRDKNASQQLMRDIEGKCQIVPGIVMHDGGVLDGNRRLAVLIELSKEHFDGVILPKDTNSEDKWRIEAGQQMGKPLIEPYSPINELLKIREGMMLFRQMKKEGIDPAPKKTPEVLVAETLYGRDPNEVSEMMRRLQLIEQYLEWIDKPGRFDLVGDRAERFKEVLVIMEDAKKSDLDPLQYGNLKAWLFANVLSKEVDNWDFRLVRKAVPGTSGRGKRMVKSKKASMKLIDGLPDSESLREECKEVMRTETTSYQAIEKKLDDQQSALRISADLAQAVIDLVRDEDKAPDPSRLLSEVIDKLEKVMELLPQTKDRALRNRLDEVMGIISGMIERARKSLRGRV